MKKINIAVVGLGYWGPNLVRNFLKIPGVNIAYLCDIYEKNLQKISLDYPFLKTTNNYNDVLNDRNIDIIAIATPLSTHHSLAKKALLMNKHVFIEKPFTQSIKEAKELVSIAKKNKKVLMVGHTFIYSSAIRKIKDQISKKKMGQIYYYDSTRTNLGKFYSDTNVLWDLATHDFAILNYLFESLPVSIYVAASRHLGKSNVEFAHVFLRYKNNISAHIHVSWLSPVKIRTILLGGSKQMIQFNDIEPTEKIKIYNRDNYLEASITPFMPAYRSGDILIPKLSQEETLLVQLRHLVDCVKKNMTPITDGISGLNVVKLLSAAEKSLQLKKEINLHE